VAEWSFQDGAVRRSLRIPTRLCANDFDTLISAALAGAGLVRVPSWLVAHCLADGRLRIVLEAYQRPPTPSSILTLRNRLLLPKVRAFVDFLQQHWMRSATASLISSDGSTVGPDRMGVRLSPNGDSQGVNDSNPEKLIVLAAEALSAIKIAFLELREPGFDVTFGKAVHSPIAPAIRQVFRAPLILNSDYVPAKAAAVVASGEADAITFGRPFIANPDLPRRVRLGLPLAKESSATWYGQGAEGYLDYSCAES
jgi:hypothetical protein